MSIPLLEGQCSPCCLSILSVMVLSLHGPLFCNVYPFEFDYSNLEVSEKERKLSLNFVNLQMLEKDNIF